MNHREYEKMRVAWVANVKIENITLLSLGFCNVVTCHLRESILEDVRDLLLDVLRRKRYNIRSSHHPRGIVHLSTTRCSAPDDQRIGPCTPLTKIARGLQHTPFSYLCVY